MKTKMIKSFSLVLTLIMLLSAIPFTASAATITLDKTNVEVVPPTPSKTEIPYGDALSTVELIGGKLFYKNPETGEKTEVAGHYEWTNSATIPTTTGNYTGGIKFYPEDTETYGESVRVSHLLMKNCLAEGASWHTIYIRGAYTKITAPPAFTCDAGADLMYYTTYTKTGGKVVDTNGKDVTASGQFYIDGASLDGPNRYLYEDTYVTARWDGKAKTGYESAYYENVLVKVTRKTATLTTAPSIPQVLAGTLFKDVMAKLTAKVTLVGNSTSYDTEAKFWVPTYPAGYDENTPVNEDITFTVTYQNPATDDTFTSEVSVSVYTLPLATISEKPTVDATALKPGMKASAIVLTGGKAVKEGTQDEVAGKFSIANPDMLLATGWNTVEIAFTPDDTTAYEGTTTDIRVKVESLIVTKPTVDSSNAKAGDKVSTLTLSGGEATEEGTFGFADPEQVLVVGGNTVTVKFTPAAEGAEYFETYNINVVIKQPIRFVDESGNDTIPEITIEYTNAKIGQYNFGYYLKPYTNLTDSDGVSFNFAGLEGENDYITVGTKKYKINASAQNQNYEKSVLEFILTVTPKPLDITVSYVNNQIVISRTTTDRINGSFEIYVDGVKLADGVKIEGAQSSAKYGWTPKTSGTHTVKAVYVPAENDTVSIEPAETQVQMNLTRALGLPEGSGYTAKVNGSSNFTAVACGDTVSLSCTFEDFECWIITGADGKTADLGTVMTEKTVTDANGGVTFVTEEGDLTCANIIFAMPDEDITVTYKLKEADTGNDPVDGEKDFFAQVKAFFENLFNGETNCPVLKWIINVFNVIVNFFTGLFVK